MILGQLTMGARQTKNAPLTTIIAELKINIPKVLCCEHSDQILVGLTVVNISIIENLRKVKLDRHVLVLEVAAKLNPNSI